MSAASECPAFPEETFGHRTRSSIEPSKKSETGEIDESTWRGGKGTEERASWSLNGSSAEARIASSYSLARVHFQRLTSNRCRVVLHDYSINVLKLDVLVLSRNARSDSSGCFSERYIQVDAFSFTVTVTRQEKRSWKRAKCGRNDVFVFRQHFIARRRRQTFQIRWHRIRWCDSRSRESPRERGPHSLLRMLHGAVLAESWQELFHLTYIRLQRQRLLREISR